MRKIILLTVLAVALLVPALVFAEGEKKKDISGCSPEYQALYDNAIVEFQGTGDLDILIVTDPLCWHCRLGHKLLGEYKNLYRNARLSFFPRRSFIGSDMAAWIIEDAVGKPDMLDKLDFAYKHLKQPKTNDLEEARMVVLSQFLMFFPQMLGEQSIEDVFIQLKKDHEPHVLKSAELAKAADIPGTPVLAAGEKVLIGYGAGPWIKAMEAKAFCK